MVFSGELKIAEVASRLPDADAFNRLIDDFGFKLESMVRPSTSLCQILYNGIDTFH